LILNRISDIQMDCNTLTTSSTHIPMWYLRSDSNIVYNPEAIVLRMLFNTFHLWYEQVGNR
jgi:hypothetical protein